MSGNEQPIRRVEDIHGFYRTGTVRGVGKLKEAVRERIGEVLVEAKAEHGRSRAGRAAEAMRSGEE